MDAKVSPLKKVGFQKKKGASPHLVKTENNRTYHVKPNSEIKSVVADARIWKNTCSRRNQSKEKSDM